MIKYLHDEDFLEVVSKGTVLVDFYADWCGPCKMLGSILEELDLEVLKVNTDEHQELAFQYGVMSIPTLILFNEGKEVKRTIGFIDKDRIEKFVD